MGDPYQDMLGESLPPSAAGGNDPTLARDAPPGQEIPVSQPPSATIFGGGPGSSRSPTPTPSPTPSGEPSVILNRYQTPSTVGSPWDEPTGSPPAETFNQPGEITNYYPNGNGGYWGYDANWNFVGDFPGSGGPSQDQPNTFLDPNQIFHPPTQWYNPQGPFGRAMSTVAGVPGSIGNFAGRIGNTLGDVFGALGTSTAFNDPYFGSPANNPFIGGAFRNSPGGVGAGGPIGTRMEGAGVKPNMLFSDYWKRLMSPELFGDIQSWMQPVKGITATQVFGGTPASTSYNDYASDFASTQALMDKVTAARAKNPIDYSAYATTSGGEHPGKPGGGMSPV